MDYKQTLGVIAEMLRLGDGWVVSESVVEALGVAKDLPLDLSTRTQLWNMHNESMTAPVLEVTAERMRALSLARRELSAPDARQTIAGLKSLIANRVLNDDGVGYIMSAIELLQRKPKPAPVSTWPEFNEDDY